MTIETFEIEYARFNEATGWFVATTTDGRKVVGVAIMQPQGKITAEGEWVNHSNYGMQFKASRIIYDSALDVMLQLLATGFLEGVKASKAVKMVKTLGERAFEVLDACILAPDVMLDWNGRKKLPEDILLSVNGIGNVVIKQILKSWRERRGMMNVAILGIRAGLTAKQFRDALTELGESFLTDAILNNPYALTVVDGIAFQDADLIAQLEWENKLAIPLDSPLRLGAAVREVIDRQKEWGHMCYPLDQSLHDAGELVHYGPTEIWETIYPNLDNLSLIVYEMDPTMIATVKSFNTESSLAKRLASLQKAQFRKQKSLPFEINPNSFAGDITLTNLQSDAVMMALQKNVCLITGGPGTGKTTIIKTLLNILDEYDITYTLSSFIAKVAIRMQEATGRQAGTLHSIFEIYKPREEWVDLYTDVLVIDEGSTVNVELMSDVISLVKAGQRVIFVGDSNQLPPIGPGEPFTQLQRVLPYVELDKIFRQAETSGIIVAAHDILHGQVPQENKQTKDVFKIIEGNEHILAKKVVAAHARMMELGMNEGDIQVLTSINAGPIGRTALNAILQRTLNPDGQEIQVDKPRKDGSFPRPPFRMGDRVMHIKNNAEVKNGEIGYIIKAEVQETPEGGLDLQDGNVWTNAKVLWVQYPFHDIPVGYTKPECKHLQLAYAITIHKSIGSEYSGIIECLPITRATFMFRQLLYTGATRAKKLLVMLSTPGIMEQYVQNSVRETRYSILADLMQEEMK